MANYEVTNTEKEAKIAKSFGMRQDVVHATGFDDNKLTKLFNKAKNHARWYKMSKAFFLVFMAGLFGTLAQTTLMEDKLNPATIVSFSVTVGAFMASVFAGEKSEKNDVGDDVREAADDRLVELASKDRGGQTPAPGVP
jgi:hypothetical protein